MVDAKEKINEILKDKCLTVGGRDYHITPTTHNKRLNISAFLSKIAPQLQSGDMSFVTSHEFKDIKKIIDEMTLFDGGLLSKEKDHWEYFPVSEYYTFYITMMTVAVELLPVRPTA